MKLRIVVPAVSIVASLMLVVAGCNRESQKGGPAADRANNKGTSTATASTDRGDTFSIKVPAGSTNVTQGMQTEVSVSISRGKNFDQDVKLTFKAPEGVQVTPDHVVAKKGSDEARVTVKAMDTATPGTTNIKVTGTPQTGSPADVDMGIEIKKKS